MTLDQARNILTASYLREQLKGSGLAGIENLRAVKLEGPFASSAAGVFRVELEYAQPKVSPPQSIFAKIFNGASLKNHATTELRFLREVAPLLSKDLAPKLYAYTTASSGIDVLLIEDLTASGYSSDHEVLKLNCLDLIAEELGRFHSTRYYPDLIRAPEFARPRGIETRRPTEIALIHGDFHLLGNVFYSGDHSRIRAIDWADAKVGLLQFDYQFSLLTNLLQSVSQNSLKWFQKTFKVVQDWNADQLL